jgi:hypothetical protein
MGLKKEIEAAAAGESQETQSNAANNLRKVFKAYL